jgi:sodium/hydrogen exchanger 3
VLSSPPPSFFDLQSSTQQNPTLLRPTQQRQQQQPLFLSSEAFETSSSSLLVSRQQLPLPATKEEQEESKASFTLLLLVVLLIVCFVSAYVLRQVQQRLKIIHETGAAILFGAILGAFIRFFAKLERLQQIVTFDSEFFFLLLLPPIIFESGYNMRRSYFFHNIGGILLFAFVGTFISAFAFGGMLYSVAWLGLTHPLSFLECLAFGSLISATDPVSVLAIFKDLKVNKNLYANVFGESVLNDAIAIVLFRAMISAVGKPLSGLTIGLALIQFAIIFAGSFFVGILIGALFSLLLKYTQFDKYHNLELVLVVLCAYASYLLADGFGLSGIVAILFCGVFMAHYAFHNLSHQTQNTSKKFFKIIATLSEMFVFAYLGLALFSFNQAYNFGLIAFSLIFCMASRLFNVFPISFIINLFRRRRPEKQIAFREQFIIWFAGLRGGMAFALSLDMETEHGLYVLTTTLFVVLVTVLVQGGTMSPLLFALNIKGVGQGDDEEPSPGFWLRIDRKYVKPFLIKPEALPRYHPHDILGQEYDPTDIELNELKSDMERTMKSSSGDKRRSSGGDREMGSSSFVPSTSTSMSISSGATSPSPPGQTPEMERDQGRMTIIDDFAEDPDHND